MKNLRKYSKRYEEEDEALLAQVCAAHFWRSLGWLVVRHSQSTPNGARRGMRRCWPR